MKQFGIPRHEKLKSRTAIDALFRGGQRFSVFPVLAWHRLVPAEDGKGTVQAGFSCSKKHFKKAVDRNRVKRLMREAWRLQKAALSAHAAEQALELQVFFIYLDKTLPDYPTIYKALGKCLDRLQKIPHETAQ